MATLVDTLAAVRGLLAPLVPGTLAAVLDGPQTQVNETPAAEVRFDQGSVDWNPAQRTLERVRHRTGIVRVYLPNAGTLPEQAAKFPPLIDAIEAMFATAPVIAGVADKFMQTGNGRLSYDESLNKVFVDVSWRASSIEPDSYVDDWMG